MIHVLILEDEKASLEALIRILNEYSAEIQVHAASSYKEAKDLLEENIRYGLFLLDVNLSGSRKEDIGGIIFAREVREKFQYMFTPIVMVTSVGAMEMQAYRELHCYQYIMKPFDRSQVDEVIKKVLVNKKQEEPRTVIIKKDGINYQVKCQDIRYIEAVPRGICIHMREENWKVPYVTLKQMMQKLPKEMFVQSHRMFAVNREEIEYIDTVNRVIKLRNCSDTVEIGVTYKAEMGRIIND